MTLPLKNSRTHATEIIASGFYYPSDVVTNDAFLQRCKFPITDNPSVLIADTQMHTRRWCAENENTWSMAAEAVRMAMAQPTVQIDDIDVVLVSSCSTIPRVHYPNPQNPVVADLSPLVIKALGRQTALAMDIKATYCAGFLRCMEVMDALLANPAYKGGIIVASDVGGRFATAESNRSAFCFIIGDSAGAIIVKRKPAGAKVGIVDSVGHLDVCGAHLTSWGPDGESIMVRGRQAGEATADYLIRAGRQLMARNHLTPQDIQWFLPMQTHAGAINAVRQALEFTPEQMLWRGDVHGYSASASIPSALSQHIHEGTIRKGDLIMSLAVGAGLNGAGMLYYY